MKPGIELQKVILCLWWNMTGIFALSYCKHLLLVTSMYQWCIEPEMCSYGCYPLEWQCKASLSKMKPGENSH